MNIIHRDQQLIFMDQELSNYFQTITRKIIEDIIIFLDRNNMVIFFQAYDYYKYFIN